MRRRHTLTRLQEASNAHSAFVGWIIAAAIVASLIPLPAAAQAIPRTADGKPDLSGIWQADQHGRVGHPGASRRRRACRRDWASSRATRFRISRAARQRSRRTLRTARRPTRRPSAICPACRASPTCRFRSRSCRRRTRSRSCTSTPTPCGTSTWTAPHPQGPIEWWMGDSRGRWEGDTLVVDVVHFNDQTWFDRAGNFHSEALHVVERYTLIGPRPHQLRGRRSRTRRCSRGRGR